eukprot:m.201182 g.201182  ORF g.201182 m.201182 type:complete len:1357 (+) comp32792_c0_seq1:68-4138(+)
MDLPTLSNAAQIRIMTLVRDGMPIDEALKKAQQLEAEEKQIKEQAKTQTQTKSVTMRPKKKSKFRMNSQTAPNLMAVKRRSQLRSLDEDTENTVSPETLTVMNEMVEDGIMSAQDAQKHTQSLKGLTAQKEGDAQRLLLMNMVKDGKMTIVDAEKQFKKLGLDKKSQKPESLEEIEGKIFNFGLYKISRIGKYLRRVLQLDFQSNIICIVNQGKRSDQHQFSSLSSIESEDGVRFILNFAAETTNNIEAKPTTSFKADSLEDKNDIIRLMTIIINNNRKLLSQAAVIAGSPVAEDPRAIPNFVVEESMQVIKEGKIEKKGSGNVAYFNWQTRWLRVYDGVLMYYKEDDLVTALNVVPLGLGGASVTKKGNDGFKVVTDKNTFSFRIPLPIGSEVRTEQQTERIRDDWHDAIVRAGTKTSNNLSGTGGTLTLTHVQTFASILSKMAAVTMSLTTAGLDPASQENLSQMQTCLSWMVKEIKSITPTTAMSKLDAVTRIIGEEPISVYVEVNDDEDNDLDLYDNPDHDGGDDELYHNVNNVTEAKPQLSDVQKRTRAKRLEIEETKTSKTKAENELNIVTSIVTLVNQCAIVEADLTVAKEEHTQLKESLIKLEEEHTGIDHDANQEKLSVVTDEMGDVQSTIVQLTSQLTKGVDSIATSTNSMLFRSSVLFTNSMHEDTINIDQVQDINKSNELLKSKIQAAEKKLQDLTIAKEKLINDGGVVMAARNDVEDSTAKVSRLETMLKQLRHELATLTGAADVDVEIVAAEKRLVEARTRLQQVKTAIEDPVQAKQNADYQFGEAEAAVDVARNRYDESEVPEEDKQLLDDAMNTLTIARRYVVLVTDPVAHLPLVETEIKDELAVIEEFKKKRDQLNKINLAEVESQIAAKKKKYEATQAKLAKLEPLKLSTVVDENQFEPPLPPPEPWCGTGPPPPPPLFGMQTSLVPRAPIVPSKKMRLFHWDPVPPMRIKESFWYAHVSEGDKAINVSELEQTFQAAATKVLIEAKNVVQIKTMLDAKRGQNLGIFKSQFKMSFEDLERRLFTLPLLKDGLDLDIVQSLRKFGPTNTEIEAYTRYKGDKSQLSDLDQFLMRLIEIPHLKLKLDLLRMIHELPAQFDGLQPSIATCMGAVDELLTSKKLEQVLLYGLSIGNHVNGGTSKGGKHGVLIRSFAKMANTRGSDKTTTLMDFFYHELRRRRRTDGELSKFTDDLKEVCQASETSIKALSAEVDMLAKDILTIEARGKALKDKVGNDAMTPEIELFFTGLDRFVTQFEGSLIVLGDKAEVIVANYSKVLTKFGEKQGTDSEELFGHVVQFVESFQAAHNKNMLVLNKTEEQKKKEKSTNELLAKLSLRKAKAN